MEIKITEPCHENWDAMTPNQQGAFCKSCMKNVVDFSKMGIEEIKNFFSTPKTERVCGRFEEKQLQELSFDDFFSRFRYWNFSKKFAVIFFMAFGFWIFSNSQVFGQYGTHMKGEVMYVPDKQPKKDTSKKQPEKDPERIKMGKVSRNICEPEKNTDKHMKMGDVAVTETINDIPVKKGVEYPATTIKGNVITKTNCTTPEPKQENMVMGMIAMPRKQTKTEYENKIVTIEEKTIEKKDPETKPEQQKTRIIKTAVLTTHPKTDPEDQIVNTICEIKKDPVLQEVKKDPIVTEERKIINTEKPVIIYPNPSNGNFIVETSEKQTVHMFDENGKVVLTKTIDGTSTIEANHLMPGTYNVIIDNGTNLVSKKIVLLK